MILYGVKPGVHIIITCAKNMQRSGQYHAVQLPELKNALVCPVLALKNMLKERKNSSGQPLFQIHAQIFNDCWLTECIENDTPRIFPLYPLPQGGFARPDFIYEAFPHMYLGRDESVQLQALEGKTRC